MKQCIARPYPFGSLCGIAACVTRNTDMAQVPQRVIAREFCPNLDLPERKRGTIYGDAYKWKNG